MKLAGALWTVFGIMVAIVAYIFALALLSGATLSIMWGWFIVPLGVPSIGLWWAMGIMALIAFMRYNSKDAETAEAKQVIRQANSEEVVGLFFNMLWNKVTVCMMTLALGFIFHWFM